MRDAALTAIRAAEMAARKARAAKLLCSAFARWARGSEAGAFVFWRGVNRTGLLIEDRSYPRLAPVRSISTEMGLEVASVRVRLLAIDDVSVVADRRPPTPSRGALRAGAVSAGQDVAGRGVCVVVADRALHASSLDEARTGRPLAWARLCVAWRGRRRREPTSGGAA